MGYPRVYADFQNLDELNRLRLTTSGTQQDLEAQDIELCDGLVLTLYTDDGDDEDQLDELLADGVVSYDEGSRCWVATVDWSALRHASDEGSNEAMSPKSTGSAAINTPS